MNSTARKLRTRLTDAEQKLWHHIRGRQIMCHKFRRQAPIGKYVVDFVCFEQKLILELDGGQHAVHQEYDNIRTEWLGTQGFKVIRFWNHDVMNNIEGVKEVIVLNLTTPHPDLPPQVGKEKEGPALLSQGGKGK
jgi:very-short-patch-repair endonuclease